LVIQDILKALIKNDYNTSYLEDIYKEENKEEEGEDEEGAIIQNTSKLFY